MLNNYSNTPGNKPGKKAAAMAAAQAAKAAAAEVLEPITESELLAAIDQHNQTETAAHNLRRVIYEALSRRTGYRRLLVGPGDAFDGSLAALAATEHSDPPRLIKVESLGSE